MFLIRVNSGTRFCYVGGGRNTEEGDREDYAPRQEREQGWVGPVGSKTVAGPLQGSKTTVGWKGDGGVVIYTSRKLLLGIWVPGPQGSRSTSVSWK